MNMKFNKNNDLNYYDGNWRFAKVFNNYLTISDLIKITWK
jgi:hypothetical protein